MDIENACFSTANVSDTLYFNNLSIDETNLTLCFPYMVPGHVSMPVYGYGIPIIASILFVINSLAIAVFLTTKPQSSTNVLLTALAVSDILGIGIISPTFGIVYRFDNAHKIMKYPFCIYHDISYSLASMFHCVSKWLTTTLAIQRYIFVAHLFKGPRLCNKKNSFIGMVLIFTFSFLMNVIPGVWNKVYSSITLIGTDVNATFRDVCTCHRSSSSTDLIITWLKNVIGTILPCSILTITTVLLVFKLRTAKQKAILLHCRIVTSVQRSFRRMERTSKTITCILISFLLTEIPFAIFYTWIIIEPDPRFSLLNMESRFISSVILNFVMYLGSLSNFFIFMTMSTGFRKRLIGIIYYAFLQIFNVKCKFISKSENSII